MTTPPPTTNQTPPALFAPGHSAAGRPIGRRRMRLQKRPMRCLPAIMAWVALVVFGYLVRGWQPVEARTRYVEVAKRALAAKDFQTARIACQRLLILGGESRAPYLLDLARALEGLGREQEAAAVLALAAPLDKPGFAPAHLHAAKAMLTGSNLTAQAIKTAEVHLKNVIELDPESADANELLAWLYSQTRNWDMARKHLLKVVPIRPQAALALAAVLKEQGDEPAARARAAQAAKFYREKVEKASVDNPVDRLAWAQAMAMQEDFSSAFSILEAGWTQAGDTLYASKLGEICAFWAETIARTTPENLASRIMLVQQGLEYAPRNDRLLQHLVDLSYMEGPAAETARATLTKLLAEGQSSALLHFILGNDAWQRRQMETARKHFSLAFDSAPHLPVVANNMAAFLAVGPNPDPPRALAIIQPIVDKFPNHPYFRDTRGQIFVKLGRWEEAIKDLEFALPLLPTPGPTHAALGAAYRGFGMPDLAAQHERLAKQPSKEKSSEGPTGLPK